MSLTTEIPTPVPDLSNPATFAEAVPHEVFDELRQRPGLFWQPSEHGTLNGGFWVATRFRDIVEVEAKTEQVTSLRGFNYPLPSVSESAEETAFQSHNLMRMDPPNHARVRRAAVASFGPRVVANFDGWVREIVDEALDHALPMGEFDWVEDVAKYIPSRVVAQVLGVPRERRQDIVDWTDAIFAAAMEMDAGSRMLQISQELFAYASELQREKLRNPADDMVTVLAQAVERGDIVQEEYLIYVALLMVAGYETTHTLMGQSMRMILEDDEIASCVRDCVASDRTAPLVDEFLRTIAPAMNMARVAKEGFEVGGTQVRKDDMVQLMFVAANRDPEVFFEPHRFNPARTEKQTLAFGSGAHRCIGNALAKLEVRILLEQLHARGVRLQLNGEPQRGWSTWINQLYRLPVRVV